MAEQTVELQPGESKVISFEATPSEARSYQVVVNGLNGSFIAIKAPPGGEIISLAWDSPPPFIAGERHDLFIGLYNPTATRQSLGFDFYDNDMYAGGASWGVEAYQAREVTWNFVFTPGSHELKLEMWCQHVKVDEKTLSVVVEEVPTPPGVIDGEELWSYWYDPVTGWKDIKSTNSWPAGIKILFAFEVRNTGEIPALFTFSFMGKSCQVYLQPGDRDHASFETFAIAGTHNLNIYGDSKLVSSREVEVTTY